MRKILLFCLFGVLGVTSNAQSTQKQTLQSLMLTNVQKKQTRSVAALNSESVQVVIKIDPSDADATLEQLKAAGLTIHARLGSQVSVTMPLSAVDAVERIPGVVRIAAHSFNPGLKTDVTRNETQSSDIDGTRGTVGGQAYTGKDVSLCVIDGGFDFKHPAFYDAEGRSRIKAVYLPCEESEKGVTINSTTLPGILYDTPEQIAQLTTDNEVMYHGTHTACIGAGTRSPQGYGGMAPDADIILCSTYPPNFDL